MTDTERPAPQYGEYATPEQQQERIRQSGGASASAPSPAPVQPAVPVPIPSPVPEPVEGASADTRSRRADRFVTIALLAYGLYTVVTTVPQLIEYTAFADTWLEMAGIDAEFTAFAEGRLWGGIAAALFALGWAATALISWRVIIRGRISWWIPLVGAVVAFVVVSVCLSVPLLGDPGIMAALLRAS